MNKTANCSGCGAEISTENIDCDMYGQYWCDECGGVSQCTECGHMIASQEMNFDDDGGEGICENCEEDD